MTTASFRILPIPWHQRKRLLSSQGPGSLPIAVFQYARNCFNSVIRKQLLTLICRTFDPKMVSIPSFKRTVTLPLRARD